MFLSHGHLRRAVATLVGTLACLACKPKPGSDRPATATQDATARSAVAFVDGIWTQHFQAGQPGFGLDDLRARRALFTPRLYDLLLRDMSDPSGDIGYVDFDLFTAAQDNVDGFEMGQARQGQDTVFVNVTPYYQDYRRPLTVAVVRGGAGWQIADIVYPEGDLVAGLVGEQTPAADTTVGRGAADSTGAAPATTPARESDR